MGSGESKSLAPGAGDQSARVTTQILITIHGARNTGKTSLVRRMKNEDFDKSYKPTPSIQSSQIIWHSLTYPNEYIRVDVWDVVDEALEEPSESELRVAPPDASTVDTFSRADGIIVMYDPSRRDTVTSAVATIASCPPDIPIIVIANFLDQRGNKPVTHPMIMQYMERIVHVNVSVRSNKGLPVVAKWLDEALLFSRFKYYEAQVKAMNGQMLELAETIRVTSARQWKAPQKKTVQVIRRKAPQEPSQISAVSSAPVLSNLLMARQESNDEPASGRISSETKEIEIEQK